MREGAVRRVGNTQNRGKKVDSPIRASTKRKSSSSCSACVTDADLHSVVSYSMGRALGVNIRTLSALQMCDKFFRQFPTTKLRSPEISHVTFTWPTANSYSYSGLPVYLVLILGG